LQDEESDCLNAISEELGDDNTSASEYAVFGWFKAAAKIVRLENKPSAMMLQLSNNRPSVNALHGSRTLAIWLGSQHYEVWTYSLELDNLIRR
jgi:hypothetical protein